jgi:hypothetical protein
VTQSGAETKTFSMTTVGNSVTVTVTQSD